MKRSIINKIAVEEKTFDNYSELSNHLASVEENTNWQYVNAESTLFEENVTGNPFSSLGGDEFECIQVSFDCGITPILLRYTALTSILSRAECFGNGIKRLFLANKSKFADHINDYFSLKEGRKQKMLALIQDNKLSALHSGSYTPIAMSNIFECVDSFISDFDDVEFRYGIWSWESTEVSYKIEDAELRRVYTDLLSKYLPNVNDCTVELIAMSSDVAETAVHFYPCLVINNHSLKLPLSSGVSVKHIGQVTLETVENRLNAVFSSFEASCRSLAALGDVSVNNKKNAMIKAFSSLNIPQKYASDICEKYGNTKTTALDVYISMCEVTSVMKKELSNTSILNYEEALAKLVTYNKSNWSRFDISGTVTWNAKQK